MRTAVITITPDNPDCQMDCQSGEVADIEILDALKVLSQYYAKKLVGDYQSVAGEDYAHFEDYLDFLRKNTIG